MISLTVILPYYNEEDWIGQTIDSLVAQKSSDFRLVLVDNLSTDSSAAIARARAEPLGQRVTHIQCDTPGKTHALAEALRHVDSRYVATCDADTIYPPEYVDRLLALFAADPQRVGVMAIDLYAPLGSPDAEARIAKVLRKANKRPGKCHAGGYAQAFRTDALREVGGFDTAIWPYVLEDHEIVARVMTHGTVVYHRDHVCHPSPRRVSRAAVSWSLPERLVYHHVPDHRLSWFFHSFLGPRLAKRQAISAALRSKPWTEAN